MGKLPKILLSLLLCCTLLSGCALLPGELDPIELQVVDLTMTLPGYFIDWSDEDWAEGIPFVYGFNSSAVLGIKEDVATLEATIPGLTAKDYADLFVESNELTSTVSDASDTGAFCNRAGYGRRVNEGVMPVEPGMSNSSPNCCS